MRIIHFVRFWLAAAIAFQLGSAVNCRAGDPELYAATEYGDFGTLDPITGTFFKIGDAAAGIGGLGFAANGRLYGVIPTNIFNPTFSFGLGLYSINTNTGANTIIGAGASDTNAGSGSLSGYGMTSTPDGTLYAYIDFFVGQAPGPASLYRVNPANGALTYVGSMGVPTSGGFASDEFGNLFITSGQGTEQLYSVNSSTGAATLIGPTGSAASYALAFSQNTLYLVDYSGGIWTVDTSTGIATNIGAFSGQSVYGQVNTLVSRYAPAPVSPVIQRQPTNETVLAGDAADFSVVASGAGPFTYQWRFNGTNLTNSAASRSTLSLSGASPGIAGNYDVVVASPFGSVTSSIATLGVLLPTLNASISPGAGVTLQFHGASGERYVLQSANSLAPPVIWNSVVTNGVDVNGNWNFTDTNAGTGGTRFYRVTAFGP